MSSAVNLPDRSITPSELDHHIKIGTTTSSSSAMSTGFTSLPDEVKRRILEFLLDRKEVQQVVADNKKALFKFDFHTAILRVNKEINDLGRDIFLRNSFVLVSASSSHMYHAILNRKLPAWTKKLKQFHGYSLRVHIANKPGSGVLPVNSSLKENMFFMICGHHLTHFLHVLRCLQLGHGMNYGLLIKVEKTAFGDAGPSLKVQQSMLDPFRKLVINVEQCKITGSVDEKLAESLQAVTTAPIHWTRAQAWACYDTAAYLKSLGDQAYLAWNLGAAEDLYDTVESFRDCAMARYDNFTTLTDVNFFRNWNANGAGLCLSWAQVLLHIAMEAADDQNKRVRARRNALIGLYVIRSTTAKLADSVPLLSHIDFLISIIQVSTGTMDDEAVVSIRKAVAVSPNLSVHHEVEELLCGWVDQEDEEKIVERRETLLHQLADLSPNWPFTPGYNEGCSCRYKSPYVAEELYLLRGLGYPRDTMEARISKDFYDTLCDPDGRELVFAKEEVDKQIVEIKKAMEDHKAKHGKVMQVVVDCVEDPEFSEFRHGHDVPDVDWDQDSEDDDDEDSEVHVDSDEDEYEDEELDDEDEDDEDSD